MLCKPTAASQAARKLPVTPGKGKVHTGEKQVRNPPVFRLRRKAVVLMRAPGRGRKPVLWDMGWARGRKGLV